MFNFMPKFNQFAQQSKLADIAAPLVSQNAQSYASPSSYGGNMLGNLYGQMNAQTGGMAQQMAQYAPQMAQQFGGGQVAQTMPNPAYSPQNPGNAKAAYQAQYGQQMSPMMANSGQGVTRHAPMYNRDGNGGRRGGHGYGSSSLMGLVDRNRGGWRR